jgi:hypothetical protein
VWFQTAEGILGFLKDEKMAARFGDNERKRTEEEFDI